jgi:hypothetical protein
LHQPLDGVFAGDDANEVSLRIDHGGQAQAVGAR